ncbi:MAG: PilZ domain-containing protein [Candidatus Elarobacter sp.]
MSESPERRQSRRVDIRIPVSYRGPEGPAKAGRTANLSGRGMLIVAQDAAPTGTVLRVAVTGADGHEREIAGEIVRTTAEGHLAVLVHADDTAVLQKIIDADETLPIE